MTSATSTVVFVVGDNVGWGNMNGCGDTAPTPRIDALAGEGARFRNYNVEAQCTPTRSAPGGLAADAGGLGGGERPGAG